jgi:fumarate reductase flavoprotein subunit
MAAGVASTSALASRRLKGFFQADSKPGVAKASEKPEIKEPEYTRVLKADVVVLGSGAAGMAAAITAKQQGVKKVLILEKRGEVGGNSRFAPVPAPDDTSSGDIFNTANENANWRTDARIIGTVIDNSRKIHDWLGGFGGNVPAGEYGGALVKILKTECEKLGIEIMCDTAAKRLLRGENDLVVVGVHAEQGGKPIRVDATVTVLATGGFLGDPELMEKYFPIYDENFAKEVHTEGLLYSGDGIKMALDVGAGNDHTISFERGTNPMPFFKGDLKQFPAVSVLTDNTRTPAIWVNNVGVRFTNENKRLAANAIYRQPNRDSFILMDAGVIAHMAKKHPGVVSVSKVEKEIEALIDADQALVTDSVGAVAAWIRGKKHILQSAIDTHNQYCEKGVDELYYKDPAFLVPLKKPPFYVFRSGLSLRTTHGPIKVSPMLSVVSKFDWPIPALMACGADIGGLYADLFVSSEDSRSIEWAIASGIGAGGNAAAYAGGLTPVRIYEFPKYSAREVMAGNYVNVGTPTGGPPGAMGPPPGEGEKSYH